MRASWAVLLLLTACLGATSGATAASFRTTTEPAGLDFSRTDELEMTLRVEGRTYCAYQPDHRFFLSASMEPHVVLPQDEVYADWNPGPSPGLMVINASFTWRVQRDPESTSAFNVSTQWQADALPLGCPVVNEPQGTSYQTFWASGPERAPSEAPPPQNTSEPSPGPRAPPAPSPAGAVILGFFGYVAALGAAVMVALWTVRRRGN